MNKVKDIDQDFNGESTSYQGIHKEVVQKIRIIDRKSKVKNLPFVGLSIGTEQIIQEIMDAPKEIEYDVVTIPFKENEQESYKNFLVKFNTKTLHYEYNGKEYESLKAIIENNFEESNHPCFAKKVKNIKHIFKEKLEKTGYITLASEYDIKEAIDNALQ